MDRVGASCTVLDEQLSGSRRAVTKRGRRDADEATPSTKRSQRSAPKKHIGAARQRSSAGRGSPPGQE